MKNESHTFVQYLTISAVTLLESENICIILWIKRDRNCAALFIEHIIIYSLPILM